MADPNQMPSAPNKISHAFIVVISVDVMMTFLSTIFVILRFIARKLSCNVGWDDWAVLGSLIFSYALLVIVVIQATMGHAGYHLSQYSLSEAATFAKAILAGDMIYVASASLSKLSILIMYRRIFSVQSFYKWIWIVGFLVFAFFVSTELCFVFGTHPIKAYWDFWLPHSSINEKAMWIATSAINTVLDVTILVLPQPFVWRLHIGSVRKKISLSVLFLLGGFVSVVSIIRITRVEAFNLKDFTHSMTGTEIWSKIEADTSIICACLPTLPALYRHWSASRSASTKSHTAASSNSRSSYDPRSRLLGWMRSGRNGRSGGSSGGQLDIESSGSKRSLTSPPSMAEAAGGGRRDVGSYPVRHEQASDKY